MTDASPGQQGKPGGLSIRATPFFLLVPAVVGVGGYQYAQQQGLLAAPSTIAQQGIEIAELRRQVTELQTTLAQERLRGHPASLGGAEIPPNTATANEVHAQPADSDQPQDRRDRLTSGR